MLSSSRPVGAAFPVFTAGRLLHYMFRGLLSVHSRYGLHARQVTRCDPFHRSTSTTLLPPPSLRLLPAERPVAGRDLHPLKIDALHGIRENGKVLFREPLVIPDIFHRGSILLVLPKEKMDPRQILREGQQEELLFTSPTQVHFLGLMVYTFGIT